ncbi:MAG TPA: hypothetical protein PKU75_05700, partial [Tetrasphaera australiensis]|nr:hypothetical protein [Tetrasphaera australiensis]
DPVPHRLAGMRTYGELFAIGEFRALFVSRCLVIASLSLASLALATLAYEETGSPILSALALVGGSLLTLLGSLTALSLFDGLDARSAILLVIAVTGAQAALQAVPRLPLPMRFAVLLAGVRARPMPARPGNILAETHRVNAHVLGSPILRPIMLSAWIPMGLIVGCEALFIPYGGKAWSGCLFAAAAAGCSSATSSSAAY